jgi:hypothetical protein
MSSIIRDGDTFHGISVFGRGVFTDERDDKWGGRTYAGQCKDGYACGLGVVTWPSGWKVYAEHGPDGKSHGRCLGRTAGNTHYGLWERGKSKGSADVSADGTCKYRYQACAPDDPRLLALIAQVAPVEVRPAARAPHPPLAFHSPPRNRPMDRPARFAPPQALAAAVATEVHPHSARRRWWQCDTTQQQPHCKARPHSDMCTGFLRYWSHGRHLPLAP